jgi:hypothetical protein
MTSSPATGSFYGVLTFLIFVALFVAATHWAFGWEAVPSTNRVQSTVMLLYYCAAGYYALKVGRHREVAYGEALKRGAVDVGRALKRLVMR